MSKHDAVLLGLLTPEQQPVPTSAIRLAFLRY
jgi:hypothetical protein